MNRSVFPWRSNPVDGLRAAQPGRTSVGKPRWMAIYLLEQDFAGPQGEHPGAPTPHVPVRALSAHDPSARARIGRSHPQTTGYARTTPDTAKIGTRPCSCWSRAVPAGVAGQGFEPWKASADGFTVLFSSGGPCRFGAGQRGYAASVGPSLSPSCQFRARSAARSLPVPCG